MMFSQYLRTTTPSTPRARTDLTARLRAEAMGEDYVSEGAASSSCDCSLLALVTARLRIQPGQLLVDAGCGTGDVGLWLARAVAAARATDRRASLLADGRERARFHAAALKCTLLPDACAKSLVCVDAFARAGDRTAAVREFARVLAPAGGC